VTLLLGSEEYTAEGASIKKAQHAAAADALVKTCFEHPPPKTQRVLKVIHISFLKDESLVTNLYFKLRLILHGCCFFLTFIAHLFTA